MDLSLILRTTMSLGNYPTLFIDIDRHFVKSLTGRQHVTEIHFVLIIATTSKSVTWPVQDILCKLLDDVSQCGILYCFQRTFVGVDYFSVFQEVYLRTNDPRVSNIVSFSDAIGELKVEVIRNNLKWSYKFNTHFWVNFYNKFNTHFYTHWGALA